MSATVPAARTERRCPDHPEADLVPLIPRHPAIACPTCGGRICGRCSGKGADWISGLCQPCYRHVATRQTEWNRIEKKFRHERWFLRGLIEEASGDVKSWLVEQQRIHDAAYNAQVEEWFA